MILGLLAIAQVLGGELGVQSRYVWRGEPQTTALSVQPAVSVTRGAFSLGVWNNVSRGRLVETDVWAEAAVGPASFGWITYDGTAHEFYASGAVGPVRLYTAYDLSGAGWYVQPGLAVSARGFDLSCDVGLGQGLNHVECGASRSLTLGAFSFTPAIAARRGLVWGGITIGWTSHQEQQ